MKGREVRLLIATAIVSLVAGILIGALWCQARQDQHTGMELPVEQVECPPGLLWHYEDQMCKEVTARKE